MSKCLPVVFRKRSRLGEQGRRRLVSEVGSDGCRYVGEDVPRLLAAALDRRQHRLHEPAAARALRAEGQLPPDDRMPQRPLAGVVGRLDLLLHKRPRAILRRSPAPGDCLGLGSSLHACHPRPVNGYIRNPLRFRNLWHKRVRGPISANPCVARSYDFYDLALCPPQLSWDPSEAAVPPRVGPGAK